MPTLAEKLGHTRHCSPLQRRLRQIGLVSHKELEALAHRRGATHYPVDPDLLASLPSLSRNQLPTEQLIIGLLLETNPYHPQLIRMAAQLLGGKNLNPSTLARLAVQERCVQPLQHIVNSACSAEHPAEAWVFWQNLRRELSICHQTHPQHPYDPSSGVLPHPSRFFIQAGYRRHREPQSLELAPSHWLVPAETG